MASQLTTASNCPLANGVESVAENVGDASVEAAAMREINSDGVQLRLEL